jgi:hypothetical protein
MSGRVVNSRVSVTEETRKRLRDFANGMGVTYEEAVIFLLDNVMHPGEDDLLAGRRVRGELGRAENTTSSELDE